MSTEEENKGFWQSSAAEVATVNAHGRKRTFQQK